MKNINDDGVVVLCDVKYIDEDSMGKRIKKICKSWAWGLNKADGLRISEHIWSALNSEDSWEEVSKSCLVGEFDYSFDTENTEKFVKLLSKDDEPVTDTFISRFGGIKGREILREYCRENDINFDTFYE